jgi:asparaginyl-tRNA synthetase
MNTKISPPNSWQVNSEYLQSLLKHPWYKHIANINSNIISFTHDFFSQKLIRPYIFPITTGSVSSPMGLGSDSLPVKINLRDKNVFLADSMQFSLEVGTRLNNMGSYYIMPTFRGENVDQRHLNEFVHAEVEIIGKLNDIMDLAELYVIYVAKNLLENCEKDILATAGTLTHIENLLLKNKFLRVEYKDALNQVAHIPGALENIQTDYSVITSIGEKALLKNFGDFLWLTNMPWCNVPFYQSGEENNQFSKTADLLAGIGEILGCGQRVKTVNDLRKSLDFHQVSIEGYEWYSEMRELIPMQTSGFGMGVERFILWITNTDDIRNCTLLYRDHNQIFFP